MSVKKWIEEESIKDVFRSVILWSILTLGGYLLFRYGFLWITCIMWASYFDSIIDTLDFHFSDSYFNRLNPNFWNPDISWENKWKSENGKVIVGKEKFPGSSTIFVFLTDGWHLAKFLMLKLIVLSIVLYSPIFTWYYDALIALGSWGIIFSIFYFLYKIGK